ncbi:MAG: hypothetical protein KDK06_21320 [Gammaproteobacteria bacterium]|nr:hypothetical protein [Gammaproteobacteria bacterium]
MSDAGERDVPGVLEGHGGERRLSATLLQSELLAFAERYMEALAEAFDRGADHAADASGRAAFRATKVVYVTAAMSTATGADPLRALRDLLVMVHLQRLVWAEQGGNRHASDTARAGILAALERLEIQLHALALRVVSPQAIAAMQELAEHWRADNPERRYVAFVRFHDLDDTPLRRRFEDNFTAHGLLAPVAEANHQIEEMRRVAERAVFLANHVPMLIEWQGESFVARTLDLPEVTGVLGDLARFTATGADATRLLAALPEQIGAERRAAIDDLMTRIERERHAALEQVALFASSERDRTFAALESTSASLLPLMGKVDSASANLRETMALLAAWQGGDDAAAPLDLAQLGTLVDGVAALSTQTLALVEAVDRFVHAEAAADTLQVFDRALREHEQRLFVYALTLIGVAGVTAVACVGFLRRRAH